MCGATSQRALQGFGLERGEQGLGDVLGPDAVHQRTTGSASLQFLAGRGLDLYIQIQVVGQAPACQRFQRGQCFACIRARVPAAGIELGDFAHGQCAADAAGVGGAIQRGVVHQKQHAVFAELGIALKEAVAMQRTQTEGAQGVFRRQLARAAVGHPAGVGPRF